MNFENLEEKVISQEKRDYLNLAETAGSTKIETKIGIFWKTDGYDDKVPGVENMYN